MRDRAVKGLCQCLSVLCVVRFGCELCALSSDTTHKKSPERSRLLSCVTLGVTPDDKTSRVRKRYFTNV